MSDDVLVRVRPLGFPWETSDPFLFCVHHDDAYPAGNERLGPAASLDGRELGQDFAGKDGWRMYHGEEIPGFPAHPHRGFETVTIVRRGLINHSDSLGAAARFGGGDVQWLTAGRGIVHAEMFPLLARDRDNPLELFQIWLNLPAADKMVSPHFSMLWADRIPKHVAKDTAGRKTEVTIVAGALEGTKPPAPPPKSWAARKDTHVAIWTIKMDAGATWTMPAEAKGIKRTLYVFRGEARIAGREVALRHAAELRGNLPVPIESGPVATELLLLQGRPIAEPVASYGPFVMNTRAQIEQAFADYQQTRFGGWPWPSQAPVHAREQNRFARHVDGRLETAKPVKTKTG